MAKTYRAYDPEQPLLLPPSLEDWLPEDHLARFVDELVDRLDLSGITARYEEERGYPPYHPTMMTKLLLYGYSVGIYAGRRLAKAMETDVAFRFLAAHNQPGHRTIIRFRRDHRIALGKLFTQVLEACREAGLVKLGTVAIDGTKIKANASKHKAMSHKRMLERRDEYTAAINEWLARSEREDDEDDKRLGEDKRGDELPEHLNTKTKRLEKIIEALQAQDKEARELAEEAGQIAHEARVAGTAQHTCTERDSTTLRSSTGSMQRYNTQARADCPSPLTEPAIFSSAGRWTVRHSRTNSRPRPPHHCASAVSIRPSTALTTAVTWSPRCLRARPTDSTASTSIPRRTIDGAPSQT